ncbi:MAG: cupin domain-containing protein [Betaproteobacteria bacterium]
MQKKLIHDTWTMLLAGIALLAGNPAAADDADKSGVIVTPLLEQNLTDLPGKEGLMVTVEVPPGAASDVHRHNAHVFVYQLTGSMVMQVQGGAPVTIHPGETFYESPKDVHTVSKNASDSEPATFLVVFIKNKGAPPVLPAKKR